MQPDTQLQQITTALLHVSALTEKFRAKLSLKKQSLCLLIDFVLIQYREHHRFFICETLVMVAKENIMVKTGLIGDQFSNKWCHFSTITLFHQVIHHSDKVKLKSSPG